MKKINDNGMDEYYGQDEESMYFVDNLCNTIGLKGESDGDVEYVRNLFKLYLHMEYVKHEHHDLEMLGYAYSEVICIDENKFNEYLDAVVEKMIDDIKGIGLKNLNESNHPLIYFYWIREIERIVSSIFPAEPQKSKLLFPFYYKLILFFENYLLELSGYKEIMCVCYSQLCSWISMHRLKPEKDRVDSTYKKIFDECKQKINKLIGTKRYK